MSMEPQIEAQAMPAESPEPLRLVCKEVWGGNRPINAAVELPGLRGHLFSYPTQGAHGGDIHFLTTCGSGLFSRMFIADVTGHGPAVSTLSTMIHKTIRRYMHWPDQRSILKRLNHELCRIGFDALTTAAVVSYYPPRRWLSVSYAGHWPALLYRHQQDSWQPLNMEDTAGSSSVPPNLPLAVEAHTSYTRTTTHVQVGDRLLLFTDGVLEAPDADGRQFGQSGLQDLLHRCRNQQASEVAGEILKALGEHVGSTDFQHDDVTVLLVECVPGPKGSVLRNAVMNRILRPRGNSSTAAFATPPDHPSDYEAGS